MTRARPRTKGGGPSKAKRTRVAVDLDDDAAETLRQVATALKCSGPEVLRRGLAAMKRHALEVQAGGLAEMVLSGDELTVQSKLKYIEAIGRLTGPTKAAKEIGVARRTVYFWLDQDTAFRDRVQEALAAGVESVEGKLVEAALGGNILAIQTILNAKHPDYGQVRLQIIQRVLGPLLERVIQRASRFLRPDDLQRFAADIGADGERVALEAFTGRR